MSALELSLVIFFAFSAICALLFGFRALSINKLNPSGKGAYKSSTRTLRKFALIRGFKVLTNISFTYKGKQYWIENLLVGYFGLLAIHTLGGRGEYYGQLDSVTWHRDLDGEREAFSNPVIAQDEAISALRNIFSKDKIYNVPIDALVVLTNRSNKTKLYITHENRILLPGKLRQFLDKTRFDKDAGIDIANVTESIRRAESLVD